MSKSVRDYEAILIAPPDLSEDGVSKLQAQFADLVSRQGGKVLQSANLGKRKLSYKIGRFSEGIYLQAHVQLAPAEIAPLQKAVGLVDSIARLMIVQGVSGAPVTGFETRSAAPAAESSASSAEASS